MKFKTVLILLTIGAGVWAFVFWQNNDIVVTDYIYETSKLDDAFDGYRIAQIADLHNKEFGDHQEVLLNILKNEQPDMIVITGDLVDSRQTDIDKALDLVKGAISIAPIYYVTGNHEHRLNREDWDRLMEGMEDIGVTLLDNQAIVLERENSKGFYLIGLGDKDLSNDRLKTISSHLDSQKLQILLAHEPQHLGNYQGAGMDLVFSGHAHGGQIRLPLVGGIFAPDQGFFPRYTSGTIVDDGTTMVVSRGLGNSIIPVRIFNRPEVVIVKLQKA